ncbi:MAG: protoheme IX farnesyltransferase [Deltaproteobacteria bacterium]|nr:protoheme IX farnesyltransferase [Deltaproteobacteria bacterium]
MLAYLDLAKPRVVSMILVTTLVGFHLASRGAMDYWLLLHTLASTAIAAAGTLALNQYLERDLDAVMLRTRWRPLPSGRVAPGEALLLGNLLAAVGIAYQTLAAGALPALVTAATTASYLFLYTPMKRRTPLCSLVGAVSGGLPPVTGWAAASGGLGVGAWVLFSILFLWQIPHSLAIAHLYRDDYARAGIRLLPVIEPDGGSTARQIVINSLALLSVALLPTIVRVSGALYFFTALALGLMLLGCSLRLARTRDLADARRLLFASLVYLPTLLAVMAIDKLG